MARISHRGYIWIQPVNHPEWKITITRTDDTIDNVTEYVKSGECNLGATETIGNFRIELDNTHTAFYNIWAPGNEINIYADRDDASTKILKGKIDKLSYAKAPFYVINISGGHVSSKLLGITVTKQFTNKETSTILKALFSSYASEFDTATYVDTSTTTITVNWYQKPFWECVLDLCNAADFDCYIDPDSKVHYFITRTHLCTTEAIVHDQNLISVSGFGKDIDEVKNRIIIYGQDIEQMPLIATAEDSASQASYGIKEEIIRDTNITTWTQALERAQNELARKKEPLDKGDVESYGLPGLKPGDMIQISDPESDLNGRYRVITFTHTFGVAGMKTKVTIEKEISGIPRMFRQRFEKERSLQDIVNPYEMRYSYNFTFDDDTQVHSHTDTKTEDGRLLLQEEESTGTMISFARIASENITEVHLRVNGTGIVGTKFWISVDDLTWELVSLETSYNVTKIGKKLRVKVEINSTVTEIDSLVVLYK